MGGSEMVKELFLNGFFQFFELFTLLNTKVFQVYFCKDCFLEILNIFDNIFGVILLGGTF